jgi:chromosome segregation ATPase
MLHSDAFAQIETLRVQVEDSRVKKQAEETQIEEIMSSMQEGTREYREQLVTAQVALADQERSVAGLQTEKEQIATNIHLTNARKDNASKSLAAAETKLANCVQEQGNMQAKVQEVNNNKRQSEGNQQKLQTQLKTLQQKELQLQSR